MTYDFVIRCGVGIRYRTEPAQPSHAPGLVVRRAGFNVGAARTRRRRDPRLDLGAPIGPDRHVWAALQQLQQ